MEYTTENLERAVCLFYRTEAGQQAEAHQWLTEAQNSPQAWSFVWDLLHPARSSEVQFFAATTLHTKLLKHWNEVPEQHYEILKKQILETIINFAMGPKIVLNRLCITLSAYIIHTVPHHWPKAFEELVSSFQPQFLPNVEPERVIWILLEILTVIPEEFQNTTIATSQRNRVRCVLHEVSKDILKVVEICLVPLPNANFNIANLTTYVHSARCAAAWIQLGGLNIDVCSHIMNVLVDLTCFVYWNRQDLECISSEEMELMDVTIEALTAIIQHPQTHKYKTYVIKHTANMLEKFNKILESEKSSVDPNKDILTSIYLLLETTADSHSKIFIENLKSNNLEERKVTDNLFTCILSCTNMPGSYPVDETSSTVTFSFWYTLQDDILLLDTAECAELLLIIKPYYRQLVCILLRKAMFPNDDESQAWTLDDKEMFRCYRQDIADTYMYCYNVLNIEMLDILNVELESALAKCTMSSSANWNCVECCLHAYSSVAEYIELENLYLPKLMVTLKNIPYNDLNVKILCAALDCVRAYSEWLGDHSELLNNVIPLVISGLTNSEVTPSCTMALKDLTNNCHRFLLPYAEHILNACQLALQSGNLKLAECIRVMFSVGRILSVLPINNIMQYLNIILAPSFEELQNLSSSMPNDSLATRIVTRLKMLSAIFGSLYIKPPSNDEKVQVQQPLLIVLQNTLPLYTVIAKQYANNADVIEVLCGLFKHAITTLMDDSKPIINDILQLLMQIHREAPHPSILIIAKNAMILFGKEPEFAQSMECLLSEIVNSTLQLCVELNNTNQLSEKSDLFEGFFSLLANIYKKVPSLILNSRIDCAALFQCAIVCLSMPETRTMRVCSAFLVSFISNSREAEQAAIVQNYGESLVLRILLCLSGSAPRGSVDILSDILLVLNKKYCDNLARWLHALLRQDGFPSVLLSAQQKENFIKAVLREKLKGKLTESVSEFALISRGIMKVDNNA